MSLGALSKALGSFASFASFIPGVGTGVATAAGLAAMLTAEPPEAKVQLPADPWAPEGFLWGVPRVDDERGFSCAWAGEEIYAHGSRPAELWPRPGGAEVAQTLLWMPELAQGFNLVQQNPLVANLQAAGIGGDGAQNLQTAWAGQGNPKALARRELVEREAYRRGDAMRLHGTRILLKTPPLHIVDSIQNDAKPWLSKLTYRRVELGEVFRRPSKCSWTSGRYSCYVPTAKAVLEDWSARIAATSSPTFEYIDLRAWVGTFGGDGAAQTWHESVPLVEVAKPSGYMKSDRRLWPSLTLAEWTAGASSIARDARDLWELERENAIDAHDDEAQRWVDWRNGQVAAAAAETSWVQLQAVFEAAYAEALGAGFDAASAQNVALQAIGAAVAGEPAPVLAPGTTPAMHGLAIVHGDGGLGELVEPSTFANASSSSAASSSSSSARLLTYGVAALGALLIAGKVAR